MSRSIRALALLLGLSLAVVASACGSSDSTSSSSSTKDGPLTVGFIYVGPKDDYGYNQAAYEGSIAMEKATGAKVLQAENVPETADAEQVMQNMIDKGAKLIFATSYGHFEFAKNLAEKNPDVVFVHQGGLKGDAKLDNLGTYFGTVYEPVYLAGIAAGKATKTNKLGYIYAFPIPQTLANINAFTLGAQSVNPKATTTTIATGSWCDPSVQAQAVKSLLDKDVDVISQHQDCTKTIIEATEAAGAMSVGYHHDASSLAPKGWVTGSEWNWGPLYTDIVKTVQAGKFKGSKYDGDFRVGLQTGNNPFVQSPYGSMVDADTKATIEKAKQSFVDGGSPFKGPVKDQDGKIVVKAGEQPTYAQIETMDYFVQGVVGKIG
ncbi:BMP family ABC transporter substrate-binding protein [Aquihabitans sp. McL0605]|uniref:BMP family ABC transporter substrate-binding protein n=1 Tax=Aquihabitans sp. McL0605 TaxID=3415671 RepID=UPI003CEE43C0